MVYVDLDFHLVWMALELNNSQCNLCDLTKHYSSCENIVHFL